MANHDTVSPLHATRVSDLAERDRRRMLIAFLRAQGRSHTEIATHLARLPSPIDVSGPLVSTDLARASLEKWIVTRFERSVFKRMLVREIDDLVHRQPWLHLEQELQRLSGGVFKRLFVVFSDAGAEPEPGDWPYILDRFASNAAALLADLLLDAT